MQRAIKIASMLKSHQERDANLQAEVEEDLRRKQGKFSLKAAEGHELLRYNGKIAVPPALQARALGWCHCMLAHPGETRLKEATKNLFFWKALSEDAKSSCKRCEKYQLLKEASKRRERRRQ